jgi:hypothetical protein
VLTAELLRQAYGGQLHVVPDKLGTLVIADTCCDHGAMISDVEHA